MTSSHGTTLCAVVSALFVSVSTRKEDASISIDH